MLVSDISGRNDFKLHYHNSVETFLRIELQVFVPGGHCFLEENAELAVREEPRRRNGKLHMPVFPEQTAMFTVLQLPINNFFKFMKNLLMMLQKISSSDSDLNDFQRKHKISELYKQFGS